LRAPKRESEPDKMRAPDNLSEPVEPREPYGVSEPNHLREPIPMSEPKWLARWLNKFTSRKFLRLTNTAKQISKYAK
jgi:hypothetical protein